MLISGCVEEDEHFCRQERIGLLEEQEMEYIPVKDYEFIEIGGVQYLLDFRKECGFGEVQNVLKMAIRAGGNVGIKEYSIGEGKIIYCPLPLELAADTEAACALYQYAIKVARAQNRIYQVMNPRINESFEIHAIVYKFATVYTIINDGPAADMELLDIRSRRVMHFKFAELGMGKIWVGEDGSIVNEYLLEGSVRVQ